MCLHLNGYFLHSPGILQRLERAYDIGLHVRRCCDEISKFYTQVMYGIYVGGSTSVILDIRGRSDIR